MKKNATCLFLLFILLVFNNVFSQKRFSNEIFPSADQFLGADGKPITKYFRDDKLHYNVEGYKIWGNHIRERVHEISKLNP